MLTEHKNLLLEKVRGDLSKLPIGYQNWNVNSRHAYDQGAICMPSPLHQTAKLVCKRFYKAITIFI